jgi:ArsR family transcriptional regulator, arsenate/arsenite/antimonite-responsive transcriptional repressor
MRKQSDINAERYAELLKVLGHPIRLRMIVGLCANECSVSEIVENLKIPQSTASQHLALLRNMGIIVRRKEGAKTCYKVTDAFVRKVVNLVKRNSL